MTAIYRETDKMQGYIFTDMHMQVCVIVFKICTGTSGGGGIYIEQTFISYMRDIHSFNWNLKKKR